MNSVFIFNHLIKKSGYIVQGDFMCSLYEIRQYMLRHLKLIEMLTFLYLTVIYVLLTLVRQVMKYSTVIFR
jgi:hypothetical protein